MIITALPWHFILIRSRTTIRAILLDVQLILGGIGLRNLIKVINREKAIKSNYPEKQFYYLLFIEVSNDQQRTGIGSKLLGEIIEDAKQKNRSIYLETSANQFTMVRDFGFSIYNKLNTGYILFLLRKTA